jgi:hypothetical protein
MIQPWVGEHYSGGVLGACILLLGESNYHKTNTPDADYSQVVRDNVLDCVFKGNGSVAFFTKAAKIVLMAAGVEAISQREVRDLWNRIAFTNYVQKVLPGSRVRPAPEDWEHGRDVLSSVLAEHRPDVVIALGSGLTSHLTRLRDERPALVVVGVPHPSSFGFTYGSCIPQVRKALARSGSRTTVACN